ncbi:MULTISPECIES: hypothetical protein [Novosphingobium]|uniref:Uncharacterized protein n=1 Tax=Novosphingobium decolorationis TaxID=2698673 RepID=A0ABX8E077_9SPHN|nr:MULTISPECIES: hypothetical protein [Novosphingobium]MED5547261.1 hypothetical protein [Pseudomonadota bacterium]QVM82328.1 hypothetical protein HT578_00160 [Novosphingobium decolorationis]
MRTQKRRALVLSSEQSGHPFRRSLPAHVLEVPPHLRPAVDDEALAARRWKMRGGDWQQFLAAYCASFLAIFTFIL